MADYSKYRAVLARIKSLPRGRVASKREYYKGVLEVFVSLGLGSGANGHTFSQLSCGNSDIFMRGSTPRPCLNPGVLVCSGCHLVKYCCGECKRQHWPMHRLDCEHPFLEPEWQPTWVYEGREPNFTPKQSLLRYRQGKRSPFANIPAADSLQLRYNEGIGSNRDLKLCFAASTDIIHLVKTVNGLPKDYHGKCNILLNDLDPVAVNRSLVILYVLLNSGPSIEESAELATHLMYSAALSAASAAYLKECTRVIYGGGPVDGDMSFRSCLRTRGEGRLLTMQTTMAIKRPMEMFLSTYELRRGLESMRGILMDPLREDDRDKTFVSLKPAHRMALVRFWQTGVLAPYSFDVRNFSQPNRLVFTAGGDWLGDVGSNPLHEWDVTSVIATGTKYGIEPADIFGCLFVHVKREFMDFARRMRDFQIDIHLTQFDPRVLSKGIAIGAIPGFDGCFDRVETSNLVDDVGIRECLTNWGPLLSRDNEHASLLMHSRTWHHTLPNATAHANPRAIEMLLERCKAVCTFDPRLRTSFAQGRRSPTVLKLVESLDAFVDHEAAFEEYLYKEEADATAEKYELRRRAFHRIHPKRFGVSLSAPDQRLPDLSRDEFYNLFTLGGAEFPVRFLEFEIMRGTSQYAQGVKW